LKVISRIWGAKGLAIIAAAISLVAVIAIADSGGRADEAQAEPVEVIVINRPLCVSLGSAFGGLEATSALSYCDAIQDQVNGIQQFVRCLRGTDRDGDGINECLDVGGTLRIEPDDFAALDALDSDQGFDGVQVYFMAFVDDDAPVRFTTDVGVFLNPDATLAGQEWFCETGNAATNGDPDCDGDPATEGDGVVVARLIISEDDERGEHTVLAIQEGIGFPAPFTIVGPPDTITIESLFGKSAIQSGSETCDFEASVDAVLGAVSDANKAVLVAKALDDDGIEIAGALMGWDIVFGTESEADEGGVALPLTPTINTGALGNAFPQFICGGEEPGELTVTARFDLTLSAVARATEESFTITVLPPADEMTLAVNPPVIACDGTQTSTVTATLTQNGQPVANGVDVDFSVATLGTVNPFTADTTDGVASTTVTPLSGVARGVTVLASSGDLDRSIIVGCTEGQVPPPPGPGDPPPPPPGGGDGGPGTGTITPPDTGSGGDLDGRGAMPMWSGVALVMGAMLLVGARLALRNNR
jgi:hypothetical protein